MNRRTRRSRLSAAVYLALPIGALAASAAYAAPVYWDGNDGAAGFGTASGTWAAPTNGTATAGWSADGTGATAVNGNSVTTTTADVASFGNGATGLAAGPIAVSGTVDAGGITFAAGSGAITLSGGTINLASTASITVNNASNTISAVLDGASAGLTKAGTGTLVLSGPNTFTGGVSLGAGMLSVSNNGNLGDAAGAIRFTGNATLDLTAGVTAARQVNLNTGTTGTIRLGAAVTMTNSAKVTGAGNLLFTQTGSGARTANLNSTDNDFTGSIGIDLAGSGQAITVNTNSLTDGAGQGNIRFGTGSATQQFTWGSGAIVPLTLDNRQVEFFNNGTASLATLSNANTTQAVTVNTDLLVSGTGAKTLTLNAAAGPANVFAGDIANGSGTVAITKSGLGNWALGGTNTYTGATTVVAGGGRLIIQGVQALSPSTTVTLTQNSSATSALSVLTDTAGTVTLPNVLNINHANAVLGINVFVGNNNTANGGTSGGTTTGSTVAFSKLTFSGLSNSQGLVGIGSVTGANGYRLQFNNAELPAFGFTSLATWTARIAPTTAPVTLAGTIRQLAGTTGFATNPVLSLDGTNTDSLVSGDIKDAVDYPGNLLTKPLAVTKTSSGTWTLSGDNTFSGGLTLSGATAGSQLNINSPTALGTGTFTISGGNNAKIDNTSGGAITLSTDNAQTWTNDFAFVGSNALNLGTGNVAMGGNRAVTVTASTLTVGGVIGGATFGITKSGLSGTLALNGANTFTGNLNIGQGTIVANTVKDYGVASSVGAAASGDLLMGTTNTGTLRYTGTGDTTNRTVRIGSVTASSTAGAAVRNDGSGPLVFTAPTFNSANGAFTASRLLTLGGTNTGDNEIQGIIQNGSSSSGVIGVTKADAGTWILSGPNTYTGPTSVNDGTLIVDGSLAAASAVSVAVGATLGGSGTV
ncbi:MAG: beta strand repeat-containing protein, partial [Phycisphaerae bacterium]